ncbi:MAG: methylenetetrahydrofolate reductase [NAD(P)H] [Burkholderiaceae bacterium]
MTTASALPISLEFFPGRTSDGAEKIRVVRRDLMALRPDFCSVTYGAGGSTQEGTFGAVAEMLSEGLYAAPHFACVGATRDSVRSQLAALKDMGVKRIVALRGDMPSPYGAEGEFRHACDLVEFIRDETGDHFHLDVAAYPETHPRSRSPEHDQHAFAMKVKSGANSAITQYFYNPDAYFRFVDDMRRLGVHVPVLPGIMPITNSSQLMRFSDMCGAEIPRWIRLRLEAYREDIASIRAFGLDVVTTMCDKLRTGGAPALHFYTMNQSASVLEICRRLGLPTTLD